MIEQKTEIEVSEDAQASECCELLPCPFCGEQPDMETDGTWIEINCCASMTRQKSDYLSLDERQTWDTIDHLYCPDAEKKARQMVIGEWNKRAR